MNLSKGLLLIAALTLLVSSLACIEAAPSTTTPEGLPASEPESSSYSGKVIPPGAVVGAIEVRFDSYPQIQILSIELINVGAKHGPTIRGKLRNGYDEKMQVTLWVQWFDKDHHNLAQEYTDIIVLKAHQASNFEYACQKYLGDDEFTSYGILFAGRAITNAMVRFSASKAW